LLGFVSISLINSLLLTFLRAFRLILGSLYESFESLKGFALWRKSSKFL
jgi:hypothetical protein